MLNMKKKLAKRRYSIKQRMDEWRRRQGITENKKNILLDDYRRLQLEEFLNAKRPKPSRFVQRQHRLALIAQQKLKDQQQRERLEAMLAGS